MKNSIFETQNLLLRPLQTEDTEHLFQLDTNPQVMKYLGANVLQKPEQTKKIILDIQKQYLENKIGRYAVIEKKSKQFIGWCGLKFLKDTINKHQNIYDIGYRLLPEFWGKGYATESAKFWLEFGFNVLHLEKIYATVHTENLASIAVIQKLGFQEKNQFLEPDGRCIWYEIENTNK